MKASYFEPIKTLDSSLKSKINAIRQNSTNNREKHKFASNETDLPRLALRLRQLNEAKYRARLELLMQDIRAELGVPSGNEIAEIEIHEETPSAEDTLNLVLCFTDEKGNNGEKIITGSKTAVSKSSRN